MLELMEIDIENGLAFRIEGKISADEMKMAFNVLRDKIDEHGEVVILDRIDSLGGVAIKGIIEKIKYLSKRGLKGISKIAIMTDKRWLQKVLAIEDKLFPGINIRGFGLGEEDIAIAFLKG